jgi:hypothetical protein
MGKLKKYLKFSQFFSCKASEALGQINVELFPSLKHTRKMKKFIDSNEEERGHLRDTFIDVFLPPILSCGMNHCQAVDVRIKIEIYIKTI